MRESEFDYAVLNLMRSLSAPRVVLVAVSSLGCLSVEIACEVSRAF